MLLLLFLFACLRYLNTNDLHTRVYDVIVEDYFSESSLLLLSVRRATCDISENNTIISFFLRLQSQCLLRA